MKLIEYNKIIKINDKIGKMKVIESPRRVLQNNGKLEWKVKIKCECGNEQDSCCRLWNIGKFKICGKCKVTGINNYLWNGFNEISGEVFFIIKRNAKIRNLEYELSNEYLWDLFISQEKKCALSGIELNFSKTNPKRASTANASLDRIDSSKGYIKGNVQWIHKDINTMKNRYEESYFIKMCELVYKNKK